MAASAADPCHCCAACRCPRRQGDLGRSRQLPAKGTQDGDDLPAGFPLGQGGKPFLPPLSAGTHPCAGRRSRACSQPGTLWRDAGGSRQGTPLQPDGRSMPWPGDWGLGSCSGTRLSAAAPQSPGPAPAAGRYSRGGVQDQTPLQWKPVLQLATQFTPAQPLPSPAPHWPHSQRLPGEEAQPLGFLILFRRRAPQKGM